MKLTPETTLEATRAESHDEGPEISQKIPLSVYSAEAKQTSAIVRMPTERSRRRRSQPTRAPSSTEHAKPAYQTGRHRATGEEGHTSNVQGPRSASTLQRLRSAPRRDPKHARTFMSASHLFM